MNRNTDSVDSRVALTNWNDTDVCIEAKSSAADRPNDVAETTPLILADSTNNPPARSGFFDVESERKDIDLDGFVADVTTIAQSACERATDYADIVLRCEVGSVRYKETLGV